jgi:hypothetical protein
MHPHTRDSDPTGTMMKLRHQPWQAQWRVDPAQAVATHESGLRVHLQDGRGASDNAQTIIEGLVPKHGPHNAPAMVQRLLREGAQMLIDPGSRGWRGAV